MYEYIFFKQTSDDSDDIGFVHFVSLTRSFELEIKYWVTIGAQE